MDVPTMKQFRNLVEDVRNNEEMLVILENLVIPQPPPPIRGDECEKCGVLVPVEDLTECLKLLSRARICLLRVRDPPLDVRPEFGIGNLRFPATLKAIDQFMAKIGYEHDPSETDEVG